MMIGEPLNDNDPVADGVTDGCGHAALLLSETMLHNLITRQILSVSDAMEIVETAVDIQRDSLAESSVRDRTMEQSLRLLIAMQRSLDTDLIVD